MDFVTSQLDWKSILVQKCDVKTFQWHRRHFVFYSLTVETKTIYIFTGSEFFSLGEVVDNF